VPVIVTLIGQDSFVARKKKSKRKAKRKSYSFGSSKKGTAGFQWVRSHLSALLKISVFIVVVGAIVTGLVLLERHVPRPESPNLIELVNPPPWLNDELKQQLIDAAGSYDSDLPLDEKGARTIQENIRSRLAWVDQVRVQTTHDRLRITCRWRKPLALVRRGLKRCYLDRDLVVLDYVPISTLAVVRIEGLPLAAQMPQPGSKWDRPDIAAAVAILDVLDRKDITEVPDNPLLAQIDRIDISNHQGRRSANAPHIILYAKDNTQIIWGAELGAWQRHLESTDEEKLNKLYSYYKEYGTLLNHAKYINLCDPRDRIPLPLERY